MKDNLETLNEATMEILGDWRAMKALHESEEDIKAGRVYDHEDVFRELDAEFYKGGD